MAFFSSGSDKEKLMILYSIKKAGIPISREQITAVMYENGFEDYIALSDHLVELENNACIATVPTYHLQTIVLTKRGEELIELFKNTLPNSLRQGMDAYIEEHIAEFKLENTSQIQSRVLSSGDFETSFALVENGDAFFEIKIKLPTAGYTHIARRRWEKIHQKLYLDTLLALTNEADDAQLDAKTNEMSDKSDA